MRVVLLILLGLCSLAASMVPRERRAIYDEEYPKTSEAPKTNENGPIICAKNTPCGWTIFEGFTRRIHSVINNSYCICDSQSDCLIDEDDHDADSYNHYCQPMQITTTETTS